MRSLSHGPAEPGECSTRPIAMGWLPFGQVSSQNRHGRSGRRRLLECNLGEGFDRRLGDVQVSSARHAINEVGDRGSHGGRVVARDGGERPDDSRL